MSDVFKNRFPHNSKQWDKYAGFYKRIEVPAKTILLHEGEISKKAYLIEKGCVRAWFNSKGKDITFQFFFEGDGVSSIESFVKGKPSAYSIEAIEPSVLHVINKKDLDMIMAELNSVAETREQLASISLDRQINYMRHFMSLIKYTPKERYANLLKERPDIIKRIPQHYIASYLGITAVSLSRIRNALSRAKQQ